MKRRRSSGEPPSEGSFEQQIGLPAQRRTEAEQLTKEGLAVSKARLLESLRHTESYLQYELYMCRTVVVQALGPMCRIDTDPLTGERLQDHYRTPTDGPASVFCQRPSCGGPSLHTWWYTCAEHVLVEMKTGWLQKKRLRKEFNRALRKGH